jgi:hypothetical protein
LLQKVEISVRESCVEVHKFARLTPTQKGLRPPKGAPAFFLKIHITLRQNKKFFFLPAKKIKSAFSEDE